MSTPSPAEIDRLFAMDPRELTDQDLLTITTKFRQEAQQWQRDEAAGKKQAKKPAIEGSATDVLKQLGLI